MPKLQNKDSSFTLRHYHYEANHAVTKVQGWLAKQQQDKNRWLLEATAAVSKIDATATEKHEALTQARYWLYLGANPNVIDIKGLSPMHHAIDSKNWRLVLLLLEKEAKLDSKLVSHGLTLAKDFLKTEKNLTDTMTEIVNQVIKQLDKAQQPVITRLVPNS